MSIKVLCNVKRQNNLPGSFLAIKFTNKFNEEHIYLFPTKYLLNQRLLKEWFVEHHFDLPPDDEWEKISVLLKQKIDITGEIVDRIGFFGNSYLLPDGTIIGEQKNHLLFLDPVRAKQLPDFSASGSLEDWKNNIASAGECSSRIMLGICNGFSGYLLKITDIENGGFHIHGISSSGKTTSEKIVVSISGPISNLRTWNITETGAEELACSFNYNCLTLDELKASDQDPKVAAKKRETISYRLCSGIEKKRGSNFKPDQLQWRNVIFSTGEESLEKQAQKGGIDRLDGDKVRIIDVPADAGQGKGIFETLPPNFSNASDYAIHLADQVQKYYGTAQIAFLEKFVADLNDESAEIPIKEQVNKWIKKFIKKQEVDLDNGIEVRFASRFALACAAGLLGVRYGVLPFTNDQIYKGILKCYSDALAFRPETWIQKFVRYDDGLASYLNSNEFPVLESKKSWNPAALDMIDGLALTINGINVIAIKPETFENQELVPPSDLAKFCKQLALKGFLLLDGSTNNTRQISYKGIKIGRFLCFVWQRNDESIEAAKMLNKNYAEKKGAKRG